MSRIVVATVAYWIPAANVVTIVATAATIPTITTSVAFESSLIYIFININSFFRRRLPKFHLASRLFYILMTATLPSRACFSVSHQVFSLSAAFVRKSFSPNAYKIGFCLAKSLYYVKVRAHTAR